MGSLHSHEKLDWGSGDPEKFKIAQVLRRARLTSDRVVFVDSLVTTALFERSSQQRKRYPIRVLSNEAVKGRLDEKTQHDMKKIYGVYKQRLNLHEAALYMNITADLATKMWERFQILWEGGTKETLLWIIRAYSPLVLDTSDVRLKVIKMQNNRKEFGVKACRDFRPGEYVYELTGLVPTDNAAVHTGLSCTIPHVDQGQPLEPHVLCGPIRFVNHHCVSRNVEFVPLCDSCAFTVQVIRPIETGEELLADYGRGWFDAGECSCSACAMNGQTPSRSTLQDAAA